MSVRAFFSSPRRRRRALKLGVLLSAGLAVALLIAFDRNTARQDKAADKLSPTPATVYKDVPLVRLGRSVRRGRDAVEVRFRVLVQKHHRDEGWALPEARRPPAAERLPGPAGAHGAACPLARGRLAA